MAKRQRGIFRRGNIYWICYKTLDGRVIRESAGTTKQSEAEAKLTARRKAIDEGAEPEIKKIANHSFKDLSEKYSDWMKGRHRSADNKKYLIGQLVATFGNLPLRRITTQLAEQFQTDYIAKGLKNSSINKKLSLLKAMMKKAVEWEMVEPEALKRVGKVKLLQDDSKRLRYLSKEECKELVDACSTHLKPIVVTALNTGMRRGEILSLRWDEHIDLKHGFILLHKTKNGERREIPINGTLRETLQRQFVNRRIDIPYVFHDAITGKPFASIKRSFSSAVKKAKISDFHLHDCRHTFASQLVMAGVDLTTVKELLGHKTLTMTLRYAHLAPSHKVKAVDMLDTAINFTSQLLHNDTKKGSAIIG